MTVSATSAVNKGLGGLAAEAMSGATGQDLAVAGSLAVAFSQSTTNASAGDHFAIDPAGSPYARAGAVAITADNATQLQVKAWSGSYSSQGNGVGASIAAVISLDSYTASLGDSANITAASLEVGATNEKRNDPYTTINTLLGTAGATLSDINAATQNSVSAIAGLVGDINSLASAQNAANQAKTTFADQIAADKAKVLAALKTMGQQVKDLPLLGESNYYTEVIAGSASKGQLAFAGGFALQVLANQTTAKIGTGASVDLSNTLAVHAADDAVSRTLNGSFAGSTGQNGIGISLGIVVNSGQVAGTVGTNATVAHSSGISVQAEAKQDIDLFELSAGAADQTGVAGILGVVTSLNSVTASTGTGSHFTTSGAFNVGATNTIGVLNLAGSIAGGGTTGVGGVAVATTIKNTTAATLGSAAGAQTVVSAGSLGVTTTTNERLINVGVAGTAGGTNSISGVASPLTQIISSDASIGANASVTVANAATVSADDATLVVNVDGAFGASGNTAVGATAAVTTLSNTVKAHVDDSASVTAGSLDVDATGTQKAINVAVAGSAASTTAVNGVLTPVTQILTVSATIGQNAVVNATAGGVGVQASDTTLLINVGGAIAIGGSTGVGGSAAVGTLSDTVLATIGDGTKVDATGAVKVTANASEAVSDDVVAASAAGSTAVSVGLASSIILDTTQASIGHGVQIGLNTAPSSVTVQASDTSTIVDIAGNIAASGGTGVGAGADVNVLTKNTYAWIGRDSATETLTAADAANVHVNGGDAVVSATSTENIYSLVAGLAAGGDAGVAGSAGVYVLNGKTLAEIGAYSTVAATGNVAVTAYDTNTNNRLVGSGAFGGNAGVGASIGLSVNNQTTIADIGDFANVSGLGLSNAIGVTTAISGSFAPYGMSANSVIPPVSNFSSAATADINAVTVGDAALEGAALFALERSTTPVVTQVKGVAVAASSVNLLRSIAVSGGAAGTAGVTISGDIPIVISDTEAKIGAHATINQPGGTQPDAAQSVVVAASSDLYHLGIAGSVAVGGTAGVGAGAETTIFKNTTIGSIGAGSNVHAASDVLVTALASENFASTAVSAAVGGTAGVAGGMTGFAVVDVTKATIASTAADPTTVIANGNVVVHADDQTRTVLTAGTVAVGAAGAGVGIGVGISVVTKDTEATIGDHAVVTALGNGSGPSFTEYTGADFTSTATGRGLSVLANSGESELAVVVAGAGGFYAGVAGAVAVEVYVDKTIASLGANDQINQNNAGANAAQDVVVTARDSIALSVSEGTVAVGIAAVGGAADVAVITASTTSSVGDGTSINANRNFIANALTNRQTASAVASIAGGVGGLGAAITVDAFANGPNTDQNAKLDNGSSGSFNASADSKLQDNTIDRTFLSSSSNANVVAASASAQSYKSSLSVSALESQSSVVSGNNVVIGAANIHANAAANIHATDIVNATIADGAVLIGAGGGAGIGVLAVSLTNAATINAGAQITSGSAVVAAQSNRNLNGVGVAGTAVGVAAALISVSDATSTTASVHGATMTIGGSASVTAATNDTVVITTNTLAGGAAGGMNLVVLTPDTEAKIDGNSNVSVAQTTTGALAVTANNALSITSQALGVAVGGGGGGSLAVLIEKPVALAQIASGDVVTAGTPATGTVIGDVIVSAQTTESTIGAGAGVSLGDGLGGAIGVTVRVANTTAEIGAATVTATGNVAVLANATSNDILAAGGGAVGSTAGVGASVGVNVLTTTTVAEVDANADIVALGLGSALQYTSAYQSSFSNYLAGDAIAAPSLTNVAAGGSDPQAPGSSADVTTAGGNLLLKKRNEVAIMSSAKGIIVNAAASDIVRTLGLSGGAAGLVGASVSGNVPVLNDTTTASIGQGAKINQRTAGIAAAGTDQSVVVAAASDMYELNIVGAVSGGGAAGIGGSVSAVVASNTTNATIGANAKVAARGDVVVSAEGREDFASIAAAGAASGTISVTGGISVLTLTDQTHALIDQGAVVTAGNNVAVVAGDYTREAAFDGAISASLGGSVGGALSVAVVSKDTRATIADLAQVSGLAQGSNTFAELTGADAKTTRSGQGVLVNAASAESFYTIAFGAGVSGIASAAGAISVQVVNTTTLAQIGAGVTVNGAAGGTAQQDVAVGASDITGMVSLDGALAGSFGAALSGGVDVGVIAATTSASIGQSTTGGVNTASTVNAGGAVMVAAVSDKELGDTVVSASASGAAIAAGISVYALGNGIDPSGKGGQELSYSGGNVGSYAGQQASVGNTLAGFVNKTAARQNTTSSTSDIANATSTVSSKTGSVDVSGKLANTSTAGTSAVISGTTINAGGQMAVAANDIVHHSSVVGAVGVGGIGIGAGVSVFTDGTTTQALVSGNQTDTVGSASITANMTHTVGITAYAGAAAIAAAIEADVAIATDTSTASATLTA